ncbi:MAG: thioredoxin [Candidatus Saccharibacteria bacterium]
MSTIIVIITFVVNRLKEGIMKAISKSTFEQDILQSKKVILLDVWAPWCGPCRAMEPILEAVADEMKGRAEVAKLDASVEMDLVQELGVSGLPTFLVFKDGKIVDQTVGMTSKDSLINLLSKHS